MHGREVRSRSGSAVSRSLLIAPTRGRNSLPNARGRHLLAPRHRQPPRKPQLQITDPKSSERVNPPKTRHIPQPKHATPANPPHRNTKTRHLDFCSEETFERVPKMNENQRAGLMKGCCTSGRTFNFVNYLRDNPSLRAAQGSPGVPDVQASQEFLRRCREKSPEVAGWGRRALVAFLLGFPQASKYMNNKEHTPVQRD